jgi:hypothetical protein
LLVAVCFAQEHVKVVPTKFNSISFNETAPQFGAAEVEKSNRQKIISITNTGSDPVFLLQIQATDDFQENDLCPTWLAEGWTCLLYITFAPTEVGTRTGRLYVDGAKANAAGVWIKSSFSQSIPIAGFGLAGKGLGNGAVDDSQAPPSHITNDEEAADVLYHSDKSYTHEDILSRIPAAITKAVADERTLFDLTMDTNLKLQTASVLVSFGVKDPTYLEYLKTEATKVLRLGFWDMENAFQYPRPDTWYYLAAAGDPRFYDLLMRGLHSPNQVIAANAALGLAKLGDARAADELVATGRAAPPDLRWSIIRSLICFPEPKAQKEAEELTPPEGKILLDSFRSEIREKGPRALFLW